MFRVIFLLALCFTATEAFAFGARCGRGCGRHETREDKIEIVEVKEVLMVPVAPMPAPAPAPVYQYPASIDYVTFRNTTGYTAYALYAWPVNDCTQGPELLGASGRLTLAPGESREISMPQGQGCLFDFYVDWGPDVQGTMVRNVDFCRQKAWRLELPEARHCCRR